MNWKILMAGVAVLGLGGWGWAVAGDAEASAGPNVGQTYAVRRGDLKISITENGTLVAKESQKVTPKIRGGGKITFLIEEGKKVEQDTVICKLDPTRVETRIESLELEILQSESGLKTAKTELEIKEVENVAAVAKAKVAVERANQEQEKYRDGEAPQQRKKLEVAIKDAETEFNRAKKNLDDSKLLLQEKFIKKSELEDHQIKFERAVVQKEGAELDMRIFEKYTHPMKLDDLATKVKDAERELSTTEKRTESQFEQKKVAVTQSEKRLKAQRKQLKERKEDLENMTIKAPCPGIVLYGDPHQPWYRENIKVGGEIWGGHTVMTIPDLRVMQVKVKVHEADIDKVKIDQKARITMDTYPGLVLEGVVSKVASVAGGQGNYGGSSEVKKFDVEITIQGEGIDKQMRPGISAKAEIEIETRPDVLYVPLQAVFAEDGEQFCHIMGEDSKPVRKKVEIGPANDNFVEILNGLDQGDDVLLYNPTLPDANPEEQAGDGKVGDESENSGDTGKGEGKS
ncbi:MAG: HlyD family secretion protein [bacterium]|nr:HlyD family secretion protein [bacterium]